MERKYKSDLSPTISLLISLFQAVLDSERSGFLYGSRLAVLLDQSCTIHFSSVAAPASY